ncbi:hypothetical protein D3C72_2102120 [compost metagenome]
MIMPFCAQIVSGDAVSKIHFFHNMKLAEQFQRPVYRCQTELRIFAFNEHINFFHAQMIPFILKQHLGDCFAL